MNAILLSKRHKKQPPQITVHDSNKTKMFEARDSNLNLNLKKKMEISNIFRCSFVFYCISTDNICWFNLNTKTSQPILNPIK